LDILFCIVSRSLLIIHDAITMVKAIGHLSLFDVYDEILMTCSQNFFYIFSSTFPD
jgi:hypothetical protein